jgi:prepilin-type processing-associated H-X9-DG protein
MWAKNGLSSCAAVRAEPTYVERPNFVFLDGSVHYLAANTADRGGISVLKKWRHGYNHQVPARVDG